MTNLKTVGGYLMSEEIEVVEEVEEVTTNEVVAPVVEVEAEKPVVEQVSPTQHRVARAERQTEERILKELGFETLDDIRSQLERAKSLEVEKSKLEKSIELDKHKQALLGKLNERDVFDADMLLTLVSEEDLDGGDYEAIVKALEEKKPKYFTQKALGGASHTVSAKQEAVDPMLKAQQSGDYATANQLWLNSIKKQQ